MWEDMVLYWAWRGKSQANKPPPTIKRIEYAEIPGIGMKLATTVFDNDVATETNRQELSWLMSQAT